MELRRHHGVQGLSALHVVLAPAMFKTYRDAMLLPALVMYYYFALIGIFATQVMLNLWPNLEGLMHGKLSAFVSVSELISIAFTLAVAQPAGWLIVRALTGPRWLNGALVSGIAVIAWLVPPLSNGWYFGDRFATASPLFYACEFLRITLPIPCWIRWLSRDETPVAQLKHRQSQGPI